MDAWQAAEGIFTQLTLLSPLTTILGLAFADSFAASERLEGEDIKHAFFVVVIAGYASRTVVAGTTDQPALDRAALCLPDGLDAEQIASDGEVLGRLVGPLGAFAFEQFQSVMTLPPGVWNGYVSLAATQLQSNLASSGVSWRQLGKDRIEGMLRYGYVLRCLDEVVDAEPTQRDDSPWAGGSDEELADRLYAQAMLPVEVSPELHDQSIKGPMVVLGLETWNTWNDEERDQAVLGCRVGLKLRLAERLLLPDASAYDPDSKLPIFKVLVEMMDARGSTRPTSAKRNRGSGSIGPRYSRRASSQRPRRPST